MAQSVLKTVIARYKTILENQKRELKVSAAYRQVLADNYKEAAFTGNTVRLRPYEVLIAEEA